MDLREITIKQKNHFNRLVTHPIQSWEWGEFREKMGLKLLRYGIYKKEKLTKAFQLTLHQIPLTNYTVGYLPKGPEPDKDLAQALKIIGEKYNCAFIKIEPNIISDHKPYKVYPSFSPSNKTLFTKHNYILDITLTEEDLLKNMHAKTRYNIRLAQKKGVIVEERTDDKAFKIYLKLYFETTARQNYHGHNIYYHQTVWEYLKRSNMARLLIGYYNKKPLTSWLLINFKDTLYYPYGGSSLEYKEVMANNLVAWEAIKLGKKLGLKKFDMWGAASPNAPETDPWKGFTRFKEGYGGKLVEYIGTYDLIFNEPVYILFNLINKFTNLKIFLLKLLRK